jgi:hypothetical protein
LVNSQSNNCYDDQYRVLSPLALLVDIRGRFEVCRIAGIGSTNVGSSIGVHNGTMGERVSSSRRNAATRRDEQNVDGSQLFRLAQQNLFSTRPSTHSFSNLDEVTLSMLETLFQQFPGYSSTRMMKNVAFVDFSTEESAKHASIMDGYKITPNVSLKIEIASTF